MDDDDFEISINSNVLSIKSPTAKHINNNDLSLLNHNTLNASAKCNKNSMIIPVSSQQNHNANFIVSTSNNSLMNDMIANTQINGNDALHTRLTFTSPKLVNTRAAIDNHISVDCFETDTVDESMVKEEPMSPDSSCPPSPNASTSSSASILDGASHIIVTQPTQQTNATSQFGTINVNLANVATYTNADLVFEHNKVSLTCIELSKLRTEIV